MPSNVSPERKRILAAYGANVIWTDPADGSDGAIRKARELAKDTDSLLLRRPVRQRGELESALSRDGKIRVRQMRSGEQTDGQVTHFVAGLGTSGTFVGTTRRLKELNPQIQCIAMQPDSPFHGFEGLKHMATAIVPPIYDPGLADRNVEMETEAAYAVAASSGAWRDCWSASQPRELRQRLLKLPKKSTRAATRQSLSSFCAMARKSI